MCGSPVANYGAAVPNTVRGPGGKGDRKTFLGLMLVWVVRLSSGGGTLVIADPWPSSVGCLIGWTVIPSQRVRWSKLSPDVVYLFCM